MIISKIFGQEQLSLTTIFNTSVMKKQPVCVRLLSPSASLRAQAQITPTTDKESHFQLPPHLNFFA